MSDQGKKTLPEALDAARDGKEFAQALQGLFGALEKAMDADREDE